MYNFVIALFVCQLSLHEFASMLFRMPMPDLRCMQHSSKIRMIEQHQAGRLRIKTKTTAVKERELEDAFREGPKIDSRPAKSWELAISKS